jgi:hypothetical protein
MPAEGGLSGLKRGLTAVAMPFAIPKVYPAPFCLLDEVDAAEANVVRFRGQLRRLVARTQTIVATHDRGTTETIVVTHNRGTSETADTRYGVSMAGKPVPLRPIEVPADEAARGPRRTNPRPRLGAPGTRTGAAGRITRSKRREPGAALVERRAWIGG